MSRAYVDGVDPPVVLGQRLSGIAAVTRALALHRAGLTYGSIATVMRIYHGVDRSTDSWRSALRKHGSSPRYHAGRTFNHGGRS